MIDYRIHQASYSDGIDSDQAGVVEIGKDTHEESALPLEDPDWMEKYSLAIHPVRHSTVSWY